jgi:hypothetical protein
LLVVVAAHAALVAAAFVAYRLSVRLFQRAIGKRPL